jgi:uncharacterized phage protein (TIGR01671 family)
MNNRFKFRAWYAKDKEIIYFDLLNDESRVFYKVSIEDSEKMQCTGLKDKNGKLIYEGDIIKKDHSEGVYKVEYCLKGHGCGGFRLKNIKDDKWSSFDQESIWMPSDEPKNFDEIIGNIYENPELLNKTEE